MTFVEMPNDLPTPLLAYRRGQTYVAAYVHVDHWVDCTEMVLA